MSYRCKECKKELKIVMSAVDKNNVILGSIFRCKKHGKVHIYDKYISAKALSNEIDLFVECTNPENLDIGIWTFLIKCIEFVISVLVVVFLTVALSIGISIMLSGNPCIP